MSKTSKTTKAKATKASKPHVVAPEVSKRQHKAALAAWVTIRANRAAAEREAKARAKSSKLPKTSK